MNVHAEGIVPAPRGYVQEYLRRLPECAAHILGKSKNDLRLELLCNAASERRQEFADRIMQTHTRAIPSDVFYMKMCGFMKEVAVSLREELTGQLEFDLGI